MPVQWSMSMLVVEAHACTAVHGRVHACHLFTTLMLARLLMFMLVVEVHACTDITGHAHACCLSTTLLTARLFMFMPASACCFPQHVCTHAGAPYLRLVDPSPRRVPRLYVTTAIPSTMSMVMLMPGVWLTPAHLFMLMLVVEVHACTDITGHAHACCLSTTLLTARLFMFMPASACCFPQHLCTHAGGGPTSLRLVVPSTQACP